MPDPRRPGWHGDDDRAAVGASRRKSQPLGVPIIVEHELTPPPQEPPQPSELEGYDSIPPPIREQLQMLRNATANNAEALAKVWAARHEIERVDKHAVRIEQLGIEATRVDTLLNTGVWPAIKAFGPMLTKLSEDKAHNDAVREQFWKDWSTLSRQFREMGERQSKFDRALDSLTADLRAARKQLDAADVDGREALRRLRGIEQTDRDELTATHALARRGVRNRRVIGAAAAVAGFLIGVADKIFHWFRH